MPDMKTSKIKLNEASEVEEFVKAAGKCDFDIDIFYNRVIIDAKSILTGRIFGRNPSYGVIKICPNQSYNFIEVKDGLHFTLKKAEAHAAISGDEQQRQMVP